jgi:hypothetical protein
MNTTQQRNYYKIFTGTNQEDGYEKIHLGYESENTEITFKKDATTHFHIPFFANQTPIAESSIISDGAIAGPIPAFADRVFKKQGNYSNSTPWGPTTDVNKDGTWLCSWLYALSSDPPQWMDRYYNPGRLAYKEALEGKANTNDYIKNDPLYYDIPSTLTFEPGVLYQYFHQGEKTVNNVITTFAGKDGDRLRLNIDDWSANNKDTSIYNNDVFINVTEEEAVASIVDLNYQDRKALSFTNKNFVNCKVIYNPSYNLTNEFTLSFWVNNNNWSNATGTQLVGNFQKGGYGVFYDNLHYNPFFVVPENTYGHLFFFNQDGNFYNDRNTQIVLGEPASPISVNINSNTEVIVIDSLNNTVLKYNHLGDILTYGKNNLGEIISLSGAPQLSIIDGNDNTTIITTLGTYLFDKDLIIQSFDSSTLARYTPNLQVAYNANGILIKENDCIDLKFDTYNNKWSINTNKQLKCNDTIVQTLTGYECSSFGIDPENNIWALVHPNKILKIKNKNKSILATYEVGVLDSQDSNKNIGFIRSYDRNTDSFIWYAVIYHNYEKVLYQVTLDGKIFRSINLLQKLNVQEPATALQDKDLLTFTGKGDFTGYDRRRIFNKITYNNNPQIHFKISLKTPNRSIPGSTYKLSVPVHYLTNNTWHLITVTAKANQINLFLDNYLRDTITYANNLTLNYEYQNDLYIGSPNGNSDNLNNEIGSTNVLWNGYIDTVRIYDYAIDPDFIQFFVKEKIIFTDLIWNIPTAPLQYVEIIDRFFKHRMPGSKSKFFNLKIAGSKITDPITRSQIERDIKQTVERIKPVYTDLFRIEWID